MDILFLIVSVLVTSGWFLLPVRDTRCLFSTFSACELSFFQVYIYRDLENWVRRPSRSLEISSIGRAHMTSVKMWKIRDVLYRCWYWCLWTQDWRSPSYLTHAAAGCHIRHIPTSEQAPTVSTYRSIYWRVSSDRRTSNTPCDPVDLAWP